MTAHRPDNPADFAAGSILISPFLFLSVGFHLLLFYVVGSLALSARPEKILSIPVNLIEFGEGKSLDKSIGPARGPGGPRALPKLGTPVAPREATGKVDAGPVEASSPAAEPGPTVVAKAEPALPGPRVLSDAPVRASRVSETSPDSLVQLPTRESPSKIASSSSGQPRSAAGKDTGMGEGIKALKEGAEIPGALKGGGTGSGPYGVPGGVRDGKGTAGGGTGTGVGGGSSSGLKGKYSTDFGQYLKSLEKRVYAVWKYPEGSSGLQKVSVRFVLDRAGKLAQAEVVESTDPGINASALEAMKKASPFPPIPESLKDLAGEPLIIRFTVAIRVRS
jgi:TonB family protein